MTQIKCTVKLARGKVPTEIKMFDAGSNDLVDGRPSFTYDASKASDILALSKQSYHDSDIYPIDVAHEMYSGGGTHESHEAVGWFRLDAREDGMWATEIEWSQYAIDALSQKKYRYVSAVFETDDNMSVTRVESMALTNIPAVRKMDPIVAQKESKENVMKAKAQKLIKAEDTGAPVADMSPEELASAVESLRTENAELKQQVVDLTAKIEELGGSVEEMETEVKSKIADELVSAQKLHADVKEWFCELSLDQCRDYAAKAKVTIKAEKAPVGTKTRAIHAEIVETPSTKVELTPEMQRRLGLRDPKSYGKKS